MRLRGKLAGRSCVPRYTRARGRARPRFKAALLGMEAPRADLVMATLDGTLGTVARAFGLKVIGV